MMGFSVESVFNRPTFVNRAHCQKHNPSM